MWNYSRIRMYCSRYRVYEQTVFMINGKLICGKRVKDPYGKQINVISRKGKVYRVKNN